MRYQLVHLLLLAISLPLLSSCTEKQEAVPYKKMQAYGTHGPSREATIVVPDNVAGKWKGVRIGVINKSLEKKTVYQIPVKGVFRIPDSNLSIKVEEFLPDFIMEGASVSSASNNPRNQAAKVTITDAGKGVYKGWLFARFPTTHAFIHPVYAFILVSGVPSAR